MLWKVWDNAVGILLMLAGGMDLYDSICMYSPRIDG